MFNSTVSGNTSSSGGGGIDNGTGFLNLTSVTVTGNKTTTTIDAFPTAGGISESQQTILKNTIVAGNTVASSTGSPDFKGFIFVGSSYNLIGNGKGMTGASNGDVKGNLVGSSASPLDPKLDPTLQLNGGTTANHALLTGSPAIDKVNSFGLTTDQRGSTRPVDNASITNATGGDGADIGAFEVQLAPTAAGVSVSGRVATIEGRGINKARVIMTDLYGETRTVLTNPFGYYSFDDVAAGETYIFSVSHKVYVFDQNTQVRTIVDELTDLDFLTYQTRFPGKFEFKPLDN